MQPKRHAQSDRVRRHTSQTATDRIDAITRGNIQDYGRQSLFDLDRRISELEREWDIERTLEINSSLLALTGAILGTTVKPTASPRRIVT